MTIKANYVDILNRNIFAASIIIENNKIHTIQPINEACDTLIEIIGEGNKIHLEGRHEVKHSIPTWQKSIDILNYQILD